MPLTFLGEMSMIKITGKNRELEDNGYRAVVIISTAQRYSSNSEDFVQFKTLLACVGCLQWREPVIMVPAANKLKPFD